MKIKPMTPFLIEILLHYSYTDIEFRDADTPAGKQALGQLVRAGILGKREDGTHFPIQHAIELYVNAICSIPLPVQIWLIPNEEKEIVIE